MTDNINLPNKENERLKLFREIAEQNKPNIIKLAEKREQEVANKSFEELAGLFRSEIDYMIGYISSFIANNYQTESADYLERLEQRSDKLSNIEDCLRNISSGNPEKEEIVSSKKDVMFAYEQMVIELRNGDNHTPFKKESIEVEILLPLLLVNRFLHKYLIARFKHY